MGDNILTGMVNDMLTVQQDGSLTIGGVTITSPGSGYQVGVTDTSTATYAQVTQLTTKELLDRYEMNEFFIEHRIQEQELLKLKETADYADHIKDNMAKNMARQIVKKISFTKTHEVDVGVHSYRGRCWVFTKEELINLIKEIKDAG